MRRGVVVPACFPFFSFHCSLPIYSRSSDEEEINKSAKSSPVVECILPNCCPQQTIPKLINPKSFFHCTFSYNKVRRQQHSSSSSRKEKLIPQINQHKSIEQPSRDGYNEGKLNWMKYGRKLKAEKIRWKNSARIASRWKQIDSKLHVMPEAIEDANERDIKISLLADAIWSNQKEHRFIATATNISFVPDANPATPEVMICGAAGSGKTTLLRSLYKSKNPVRRGNQLARQDCMNFYSVGGCFNICETPGYGGYVTTWKNVLQHCALIRNFIRFRPSLKMVYYCMDSGDALGAGLRYRDLDMLQFLSEECPNFTIVLTKCDRLIRSGGMDRARSLQPVFDELSSIYQGQLALRQRGGTGAAGMLTAPPGPFSTVATTSAENHQQTAGQGQEMKSTRSEKAEGGGKIVEGQRDHQIEDRGLFPTPAMHPIISTSAFSLGGIDTVRYDMVMNAVNTLPTDRLTLSEAKRLSERMLTKLEWAQQRGREHASSSSALLPFLPTYIDEMEGEWDKEIADENKAIADVLHLTKDVEDASSTADPQKNQPAENLQKDEKGDVDDSNRHSYLTARAGQKNLTSTTPVALSQSKRRAEGGGEITTTRVLSLEKQKYIAKTSPWRNPLLWPDTVLPTSSKTRNILKNNQDPHNPYLFQPQFVAARLDMVFRRPNVPCGFALARGSKRIWKQQKGYLFKGQYIPEKIADRDNRNTIPCFPDIVDVHLFPKPYQFLPKRSTYFESRGGKALGLLYWRYSTKNVIQPLSSRPLTLLENDDDNKKLPSDNNTLPEISSSDLTTTLTNAASPLPTGMDLANELKKLERARYGKVVSKF